MAQTTTAIPRGKYQMEISQNGSSWVDISGQAVTVVPSGGERMVGSQNTADGSAPVVTNGDKTAPITLTIRYLYTETASEAQETLEGQTEIYARFSPAGGGVGDKQYTCADDAGSAFAAVIRNNLPPELDAGSGDPAIGVLEIVTPKLAVADITT